MIVTIAIGLDASCHVNSQLGAVIVWLVGGAGPMMSVRKAVAWQIAVDARSNHVGGDGARIRGDALVDAAVCFRMDFIFDLPRRDAQARRGRARCTDRLPHYLLRHSIFT